MIRIDSAEEFERWLAKMPQRNPKAYERLSGAGKAGFVRSEGAVDAMSKAYSPPPPKESTGIRRNSTDFKTMASGEDGSWDGEEPEIIE